MTIFYSKCNPGGNITAIVKSEVAPDDIVNVSKEILAKDSEVEQVGFIQKPRMFANATSRLQMMGGEFCGNATRCFGSILFEEGRGVQEGDMIKVNLEVSGSNKLLEVTKDSNGLIEIEMPIKNNLDSITERDLTFNEKQFKVKVVELEGITHVLIDKKNYIIQNKEEAKEILKELSLLEREASGVINFKFDGKQFSLTPFVWVRDTESLYEETACGSGTVALALSEVKNQRKNLILEIIQPSNKILITSAIIQDNQFKKATIKGKVEIMGDYQLG